MDVKNLSENNLQLLKLYFKWLTTRDLDKSKFIIDSSFVLALHGIRKADDLDFLHLDTDQDTITKIKLIKGISKEKINSHNSELKYYNQTLSELINDPKNYEIYHTMKIMKLSVVYQMKKIRNEEKDQKDIKLIEDYLTKNKN